MYIGLAYFIFSDTIKKEKHVHMGLANDVHIGLNMINMHEENSIAEGVKSFMMHSGDILTKFDNANYRFCLGPSFRSFHGFFIRGMNKALNLHLGKSNVDFEFIHKFSA